MDRLSQLEMVQNGFTKRTDSLSLQIQGFYGDIADAKDKFSEELTSYVSRINQQDLKVNSRHDKIL